MLRFSLARLIRRAMPRKRGTLVLRAIVPARVQVHSLERIYLRAIRLWWDAARDQIVPAYRAALEASKPDDVFLDEATGGPITLSKVMAEVGDTLHRLVMNLTVDLSDWTFYIERWHRVRWGAALQPHGVTAQTLIGPADVADTLEIITNENVSLIRHVQESLRREITHRVLEGFTQRQPAPVLARRLNEVIGGQRKRALRIAIDQTSKLSSILDEERMKQAGLDEFQWQHSGKVHYRPHHLARDGKIFKWGEIPADDMPGIPWFCGCKKRAVIRFDDGTLPS